MRSSAARSIRLLAAAGACALASPASASAVMEGPDNGTLATAQLLHLFSFTPNADITASTTIAHTTVLGGANVELEYDYYTFIVGSAGTTGIFDIDYAYFETFSFDPFLALLDMGGNFLAGNDDLGVSDPGSTGIGFNLDPYITYTFENAGMYAIRVGSCCSDDEGNPYGSAENGRYQLHVSLAPVPEPSTWAMMLLGFGAVGGALRRGRRGQFTNATA